MSRYARLQELGFDTDDSELFEVGEVGMNFLEKLADGDAELAQRTEQQKSIRDHIYTVPSSEPTSQIFSKPKISKGFSDDGLPQQQQKQQEHQNIENWNPNGCAPDPTTQPSLVAVRPTHFTASGAVLQEQQQQRGGGRGASPSGRWVGRNTEEGSGKWRPAGYESYHRENASSVLDTASINSTVSSRAPSLQRWPSYREREPSVDHQYQEHLSSRAGAQPQHHQLQEKQSCSLHSSCSEVRNCQRLPKESSPREVQFNASIPPEKRSLPSVMHPRSDASYGGCFTQERGPTFQRSSSATETPGLQRSSSTRDSPGRRSEMTIENWGEHPASRSAHVSDRNKHRSPENHELETQKLRERFREPPPPCKNFLQAKQQTTNQQHLRYNYEQPGFVEREKENICSEKAYTIYGVKEVKECPKASSGRQQQFVRAFSVRENGSNYTKMPRAYSVNAGGRHVMPMECDTCGKGGIGIVFLGLPGNEASFCKACRTSSGSGWSCGETKPPKKKKAIMDYCRKILRLPQKFR